MKRICFALGFMLIAAPAAAQWVPPIGVPAPTFGVNEVAPAVPDPWITGTAGFYYVDNTHPSATDTPAGRLGYPAVPRLTIPTNVPAGSVVTVTGGPYVFSNNTIAGGDGTAENPIFYRGIGAPVVVCTTNQRSLGLYGSYVVWEGFFMYNLQIAAVGTHISVRFNEATGMSVQQGGTAIYCNNENIVIYGNYVHDNGNPENATENDISGTFCAEGALFVWVVDNHYHGNGGVSIHFSSEGDEEPGWPQFIFIGRNLCHEEGENCVNIKGAKDVIISQNYAYLFGPTAYPKSGSDGSAFVLNDDNAANGLNNRIWFLFNNASFSTVGIRTQNYAALIGNVIHRITNAGILSFGPHNVHAEHNTIYLATRGFERRNSTAAHNAVFVNNITNNFLVDDISLAGNGTSNATLALNLFDTPARIEWLDTLYSPLSAFTPGVHTCTACLQGEPLFLDVTVSDYRLTAESPARGVSFPSAVYDLYESLYGVSIKYDAAGMARPNAAGPWDIGAFEFQQSESPTRFRWRFVD